MELSTIRERPNNGCIDLVVDDRSRCLIIQWAKRFIVAVDLVPSVVPLLQTMAREMEPQRVSWLNTLHKPLHRHSDVLLCWNLVNISFFIYINPNSSVRSCQHYFCLASKLNPELDRLLKCFKKYFQSVTKYLIT